jgi:hypothetical protein
MEAVSAGTWMMVAPAEEKRQKKKDKRKRTKASRATGQDKSNE